ncbi:sigma-70 family RNA polymerase sigma factor [Paenibacillus sp. P26]|nr:sigma-70 family RNA polymerase sigma factor [Paenibacillus sp. P26]
MTEQEQTLRDWMHRFGKRMIQLAFYYVKERMTAEDIVQDVFVKAFTRIEELDAHPQIEFVLLRMTIQRSKDVLKSWSYRKQRLTGMLPLTRSETGLPENQLMRKLGENELLARLLGLPLKYREVVLLYYFEGYKSREIAEPLGEKQSTVRVRLTRALDKLRTQMQEEMPEWNV